MTPPMTSEDVLNEFRAAGALREGHFVLSSGLHSPVFLQKNLVFMHADRCERLCKALAEKITAADVESLGQGIVEWHKALAPAGDTTCVFRDSAFADDVAKTNLAAILEQNGIVSMRSL